jgi:hypothetical protein
MTDALETPEPDDVVQWGQAAFSHHPQFGRRLIAEAPRGKVVKVMKNGSVTVEPDRGGPKVKLSAGEFVISSKAA